MIPFQPAIQESIWHRMNLRCFAHDFCFTFIFQSNMLTIIIQCFMRYSEKPSYQQEGLLGKGSFAQVYKVRLQGKLFALKRIYTFHLKDSNYYKSIKRQISIMQKLNHPNIVQLIDVYQTENSLQMLLQYLPGGNLYDKLKCQSRLPESTAKKYLINIVKAVKYLHSFSEPILHRDIKPENILVSQNDQVKLCDFGSANMVVPDHARDSYVGTAQYMAPEMKELKTHDQSLDLWCIGVLIYELLTGNVPDRELPIEYPDYISKPAEDLIKKILIKDQHKRITIQQIQSHIWFDGPVIAKQIKKLQFAKFSLKNDEVEKMIKQKSKEIRQKYLISHKQERQSIGQLPLLASSSSLLAKAAQQTANQYMNEFKKICKMNFQVKQNQKLIKSKVAYIQSMKLLCSKNEQIVNQIKQKIYQRKQDLRKNEIKSQVKCLNAVSNLIDKLQKLKQFGQSIPQIQKQKILRFSEPVIEQSILPISQYIPKLKLKMLQHRRNSLIQLKCIRKRKIQMKMILVQKQEESNGSSFDINATTQQILFKDHL